jgi:isoleucyl-tRNA synthetase
MLGNLGPFDPASEGVAGNALLGIDAWILTRAEDLVARCLEFYKEYAFHKVYRAVYDFAATDLSAVYFDVAKDRLYTAGPNSVARRSSQTALYRMNSALVRLLAPLISFTCEEVWKHMKAGTEDMESVHIASFPAAAALTDGLSPELRARAADWDKLVPVRDQVLKALDTARDDKIIGSSLEAGVSLSAGGELQPLLERHASELPGWFIVSQVELESQPGEGLTVSVDRARGDKCERCWKFTTDVGANPEFPTVCAACAAVLTGVED